MRVFNEQGEEIFAYSESDGYTTEERRFLCHHDAVEAVKEESHYEVIRTYSNGGKDVRRVIDVPGVDACEPWDEYETVLVFHPYESAGSDAETGERPSQLDRIEAQVFYTAMMTDTLLEGENV